MRVLFTIMLALLAGASLPMQAQSSLSGTPGREAVKEAMLQPGRWICPGFDLGGHPDAGLHLTVLNAGNEAAKFSLLIHDAAGKPVHAVEQSLEAGRQAAFRVAAGDLGVKAGYIALRAKSGTLYPAGHSLSGEQGQGLTRMPLDWYRE